MVTAYRLASSEANTPVSYWMTVSIRNLNRWLDVVAEAQARDKRG